LKKMAEAKIESIQLKKERELERKTFAKENGYE